MNREETTEVVVKKKGKWEIWIAVMAVIVLLIGGVVGIVVAQSPTRKLQQQLELGNRYLEELDYEQAIAAYQAAIKIEPKNEDAYKGLADAYIAWADDIASDDPDRAISLLAEAIDSLERMRDDANGEWIDNQLARLREHANVIKANVAEEIQGAEEEAVDSEALVDPYTRLDAGEYEEVLAEYLKLLEDDPENAEIYLVIVEAYLRMGDYDKAMEYAALGYEKTGDERLKEKMDMIDSGNISDASGRVLKMTFIEDGQVQWWHEYTYNSEGRSKSTTVYDATGSQTDYGEYEYDDKGRMLVSVGGYSYSGGMLTRYIYSYDDLGRMIKIESGPNKDFYVDRVEEVVYAGEDYSLYRTNETGYDEAGNVSYRSYSIYKYDDDGRLGREEEYIIESNGSEHLSVVHEWEHDAAGNTIKYVWTGYDESGNIDGQDTTVYEYDENGNMVKDITYDENGNVLHERSYQ